ncbi:MAG: thioesterase [Acidobacteria bacterium]|nr:MAG: thioesterase [Acidobacteriota bacterium]
MARLRLAPPENVIFTTHLDVRVTDVNYGKHLGHMELIGLLHHARAEFLAAHGMTEIDIEGRTLLVVDLAVSYRSEAFFGQTLMIDIGMVFEGSRGLEFTYGVRDQATGELVAVAQTGVVFADPEARAVVQVPQTLRALIEEGVK